MKSALMIRISVVPILLAATLGAGAFAQLNGLGRGWNYRGNYLGAVGLGTWVGGASVDGALANRINTRNVIWVNEYIRGLVNQENRGNARSRALIRQRHAKARRAMLARIHDSPELVDLMKGDALNAIMLDLTNPKVDNYSLSEPQVPLSPDVVRSIPFRLGEKGETFSLNRLSLKGRWVVAFQDPRFVVLKRAYEHAVEDALDLAIDGKMNQGALDAIDRAVTELEDKMVHTPYLLDPSNQRQSAEARIQINQIRTTTRLFQTHKIQMVLAEITDYFGTSVGELAALMRKHSLGFAPAENPDERDLYPRLYTALDLQRSKAGLADDPPAGRPINVD